LKDTNHSDNYIRDEIGTFFVGGFHTSGNLLTWLLYYVSSHEEVFLKIREEVNSIVNDFDNFSPKQYSSLVYCLQVIKETLRLSNLAPWAARFSPTAINIGNYSVAANTSIIQALGVSAIDPNYWKNPQEFNPERFKSKQAKDDLPFVPFGFAGGRVCPGMNYSYYFGTLFLVYLAKNFNLKLETKDPIGKIYGLVTKPDKPIFVTLTSINGGNSHEDVGFGIFQDKDKEVAYSKARFIAIQDSIDKITKEKFRINLI